MLRTVYSHLTTEELLGFAMGRDSRSDMEVELAQRLMLAVDMMDDEVEEQEVRVTTPPPRLINM